MKTEIIFNKDDNSASLYIMKIFHTTVDEVWNHFTKADLLDQWWAPKPWKCQTLKMDFAPEGVWNYAMVSPENEKSFSGVRFHEINFHRSFDYSAFFT
ncbi:MAG: SRPBCC domain-containing protein, partial [Flavobacteriales bacterium]|nr:SRPBCC domain-containing protein [Flavobacteriales bacterium]